MCASIIKRSTDSRVDDSKDTYRIHRSKDRIVHSTCRNIALELLRSQAILFSSRKKWGLLFAMATISGIFCAPTAIEQIQSDLFSSSHDAIPVIAKGLLPISTLLIITGMYVLNDMFDADLDRINGKTNRPIPSGKVSKTQAILFVIVMNIMGLLIVTYISNMLGLIATSIIVLIGILYSVPRVSLKDRFIIKTFAISVAMMCSLLAGASIYSYEYLNTNTPLDESTTPLIVLTFLFPMFSGVMLFSMVFVTSPLNDLADIGGDKKTGRKTIPLVIGKENTVKVSIMISLGMAMSAWLLYIYLISFHGFHVSYMVALILPCAVSITCVTAISHLVNVLRHLEDRKFLRDSITKRSMPLHLLLQASLAIGCSVVYLTFW